MPTQTNSIYDKLVTLFGTSLSSYQRLPNPYIAQANSELVLTKAWGLGVGPGTRQQLEFNCNTPSYERIYNLLLINQVTSTDHDISARSGIEKSIIDDFIALNDVIEANVTLDGLAYDAAYVDDSGIEFLDGKNLKYISISINYSVKWREP